MRPVPSQPFILRHEEMIQDSVLCTVNMLLIKCLYWLHLKDDKYINVLSATLSHPERNALTRCSGVQQWASVTGWRKWSRYTRLTDVSRYSHNVGKRWAPFCSCDVHFAYLHLAVNCYSAFRLSLLCHGTRKFITITTKVHVLSQFTPVYMITYFPTVCVNNSSIPF